MQKKRYLLAMLAAMFSSGWFMADGPGLQLVKQFLAQVVSVQNPADVGGFPPTGQYPSNAPVANGQFGGQSQTPAYPSNQQYANYPSSQSPVNVPAINANFRPNPPAPPTPG